MMIRLFALVLLVCLMPAAAIPAQTWKIVLVGDTAQCGAWWFLNDTTGWASVSVESPNGYINHLLATRNGGATWDVGPDIPSSSDIHGMQFVDTLHGWVWGCCGGGIMQTTDGGTTWQDRSGGLPPNPSNPSERFDVRCAYFVNPMVGWVAGTFFGLLKTTDGGESWQTQHLDWEAYEYYQVFTEICFIDSSRGWAIAGETGNRIVRTTDGGATWLGDFRRDHISDGNLTGLSFPDASHGFVGNRDVDYPPMATTDGGTTWSALPSLPTGYFLWDMTFVDSLHGWAAGLVVESEPHRGLILETKDGGTSWTADAFAEPTGFLQLRFPSPNVGYVLGVNGSLLRYSRLSGVAQDRETPEVAFALCPNPAGGRVSVRGSESLAGKVRLLVTSALGERVASSVVGEMDRRAGEIGFSVEGWPPGVYLCTILGAGTPVTLPLIVR